ncbi:RHS repeat domain-containing protein [Sulfuriroseicoccus oceanibius]|uniref:Teneurin-like YD-shell domain-containing protein n=1 Tax=Sulfuriroseicoccus oceanibius TaxID=2707525 RepID=A0A7T7EZ05_9BACT|nr:RHS repeat-associated core domain-containing protein [Sulfuriroseicoccus oceanibius]QQL43726.1 hypothetical protein G3M56_007380 [Sulfuriroseicoccus oceanibius]
MHATVTYASGGFDIEVRSLLNTAVEPTKRFEFRGSTNASGEKVFTLTTITDPQGAPVIAVHSLTESTNASGNKVLVSTDSLDGLVWRRQTLTYSEVPGEDPAKNYFIERVIEEQADTANSGQTGGWHVISHTLEQYRHYPKVVTPSSTHGKPDAGGTASAVMVPAVYEEPSLANRRLVACTTGYGSEAPRTTTYDYWSPVAGVGEYSDSFVHARLKSIMRPDGSWVYYEYAGGENSPVQTLTRYSSYLDYTIDEKEMAKKEVSTISDNGYKTVTYLGGVQVALSTITEYGTSDGGKAFVHSEWDGGAWDGTTSVEIPEYWSGPAGEDPVGGSGFTNDGRVWTTTARYSEDHADHNLAGRPKYTQHRDGTYTVYSYASAPNGGFIVTEDRGAGSKTAITDGSRTVTTYNAAMEVVAKVSSAINAGAVLELNRWEATATDRFGRPTTIVYNGDTTDTETKEYGCCGLAKHIARDGSITEYFRNPARRTYKTVTRRSAGGAPITTLSLRTGRTTNTSRLAGGETLFVSSSTKALNGELISTTSPDADGDESHEVTTYAIAYPASGGKVTTVTYPDDSQSITTTFRDGRTKSVSGSAVADRSMSYGTHTLNGGGIVTTTSLGGTSQATTTYYDALGRAIKSAEADGSETVTSYFDRSAPSGSRFKLKSVTDPDGLTVSYAYNAEGERTTVTQPTAGGTRITVTESDVVDGNTSGIGTAYRTTTTVNGKLITTNYRSADGLQAKSVTFAGTSTSIRTKPVDGAWTVISEKPDGTKSKQAYTDGQLASAATYAAGVDVSDPTGYTLLATHTYDHFGRATSSTDARIGATVINGYTPAGQPTSITSTDGTTTSFSYDNMGRRLTVDAPDTLDASGATLTNVTHTSYYPTGQVKATWGAQTYPRFYEYDEQGRMTALHTYQSAPTLDQTTAAAPAGSAKTTWSFSPQRGWLASKTYADGKGTSYTYTAAGRLATRAWAREVTAGVPLTTTYGYTAGQLTSVSYNDGGVTPNVTYTYDAYGRQTSVTNGVSTNTYAYDDTDFTLDTETIALDLDADGTADVTRVLDRNVDDYLRPQSISLLNEGILGPDGNPTTEHSIAYGYDAAGRLGSVSSGGDTFTYAYLANSNLLATVTGPVHTVTNTWENNRNVLDVKSNATNAVTPAVVSAYDYSVNEIGQRESLATSGSAFAQVRDLTWGYDALGQVVKEDDANSPAFDRGFAYDAIGNRTASVEGLTDPTDASATSYSANALNQYTAVGAAAPVHDADGNLTDDAGMNNGTSGDRNFVWNAENRLIEVKDESDGTTIATYAYDALGRRVHKSVSGGVNTAFIYDDWNVIAEYQLNTENFELVTSYVWGSDLSGSMQGAGGVGGLLSVHQHSTDPNTQSPVTDHFFPTYDGNGNISEYLDASGNVSVHLEYDAFGKVVKSTGTVDNFRYRFSTKPKDDEIGWYYYGYRYYDPITGRWPGRDPIMERGGYNLYSFLRSGGGDRVDYLGLATTAHAPSPDDYYNDVRYLKETAAAVAKQRKDHLDSLVQNGTPAGDDDKCVVVTILIRLPLRVSEWVDMTSDNPTGPAGRPVDPTGGRDYGHAGIAVGGAFYDIRAGSNIWWSDAEPHWDNPDLYYNRNTKGEVGLGDVQEYLDFVGGSDIVTIKVSVCEEEAAKIEAKASELQEGVYSVINSHCAALVCDSLNAGGAGLETVLPAALVDQAAALTHTCGENKDKPAEVSYSMNDDSTM